MSVLTFLRSLRIGMLLAVMCCPVYYCMGQKLIATDADRIHNAKIVMLSEWHLSNFLPAYKCKLIERLHREDSLTDLILEVGKSSAYLLNEYIKTGDTSIRDIWTRKNHDFLDKFRGYKLPSGKPVKIHGIDFERMDIVPALKRVLEKTGYTRNELYKYLVTLPDTILNLDKYDMLKTERSTIIKKCVSLYNLNVQYYSAIYDDGFIVKEICENAVLETQWDKRFEAMAHNLRMLYQNQSHKYLLIIGMFHVDCPVPVYKELEQAYKLRESDIVNITVVVKDCEAEAMYQGKGMVQLSSSRKILDQPGLVDTLYKIYSLPCIYQLVDVRARFPDYRPGFKCDYILPIDCKLDTVQCD